MNYFDSQPQDQPIMPPVMPPVPPPPNIPTPPSAPVPQPMPVSQPGEFKGLPVRAMGDRIFLLKGGKRYWISTPETYTKLGFKFGDEVKMDQATLMVIPEGEVLK